MSDEIKIELDNPAQCFGVKFKSHQESEKMFYLYKVLFGGGISEDDKANVTIVELQYHLDSEPESEHQWECVMHMEDVYNLYRMYKL